MRFLHLRKNGNKGGLTIGYVLDEMAGRAVVTVAQCSRKDNYDRKKGKLICENRYEFGTGWLVPVDVENIEGSIACEVIRRLRS